jgi:hypothetical protein
MIRGFAALIQYTGLSEHLVRRATAYYGFPAHHLIREGSVLYKAWEKASVDAWMIDNCEVSFVRAALIKTARRGNCIME